MHILQAITTHYVGPTNTKGSRCRAKCAAKSIYVEWDPSLNSEQNHAKAAEKLANKMNWDGHWFGGGLPDDRGYCWVQVSGAQDAAPIKGFAAFRTLYNVAKTPK